MATTSAPNPVESEATEALIDSLDDLVVRTLVGDTNSYELRRQLIIQVVADIRRFIDFTQ